MAKAEIIEDLGSGQYTMKRIWAGRAEVQTKIDAYNAEIVKLQAQYDTMPVTTDEELFAKHVVGLQIKVFEKKVIYFTDNFPEDETVDAWCTDYTEGLTGEVGTIDIAGEKTTDVNIRPNGIASNAYSGARDGELYPAIALGPWTSFLNQCIYPGWQRFKPLHRYAFILEGSIGYAANTCVVAIQPTFSLMNYNVNRAATGGGEVPAASGVKSSIVKNYNVNYGDLFGREEIELFYRETLTKAAAREFFVQNLATAHPGWIDFVERYPDHPISNVTQLAPPVFLEDEQYIAIQRICTAIDMFGYVSDPSGYKVADHWDFMLDWGDPWYWYPSYKGEPQNEFFIGDIPLIHDPIGYVIGAGTREYATLQEAIDGRAYNFGWHLGRLSWRGTWDWYEDRKHLELEFEASRTNHIAPNQRRGGDCVSVKEEIYTIDGIKKVGDLKVGDLVLSYDFDKQEYCHKPIIKIWEKGLLPGKSVGLKNGQSIDITENHPLWARTNQTSGRSKYKISHYEKAYFKDINLDQWWRRRLPIAVKIPYKIKDIEWLNEDLCFVLGHYLAEGWKEPHKIQLSGYELVDYIFPLLIKHKIPYSDYKNNSGVPCARVLKCEFKDFLGTLKENSFDIHLPEALFHLPEEKLEKILAGFYLGDGHNGNYSYAYEYESNKQEVYSTSSKQWASDIQRIGLQLGRSFHIWKQKEHGGSGNKPIYRITHNSKSHFYRNHGYDGISEVGIARKHIEDIGPVEMRDFEVAGTHTFIFKNGLICHQCEDFVLTKMQAIIEAGIVPAENLQVLLCYVVNAGYHAVLGIQTANRGFLISDQMSYGQLWKIEQLSRTHIWESFSVATAATGDDAILWAKTQLILKDVPIEYMDCDSNAFAGGEEVVVEFTGQDWEQPKVIGFRENPQACTGVYVFPAQKQWRYESQSSTMKLSYNSEAWAWKNPFPRDYSYPTEDQLSRVEYAATGENGLGFTVGGRTLADAEDPKYFFDHLDIYDSVAESFSIGNGYPEEIFNLTFNSLKNGRGIAHGGQNDWSHTGTDRTYRYNITSDTWDYRANGEQVYNHASFVIDSVVYVVGGNRGDPQGVSYYYGEDSFGFGIRDYFTTEANRLIPNQTVTAYNDSLQTWSQKEPCPISNYVRVNGWSLEGKGLVGGSAHTYQYEAYVEAGYEFLWSCPSGSLYWDIDDALDECGQDYDKVRVQVMWISTDIGSQSSEDSYLYDSLTDSWTQKHSELSGCGGNGRPAVGTANNETIALAFSGRSITHWYDYKLSTDTWTDRGVFGLTVNEDPVWYSHRLDAAGAEL